MLRYLICLCFDLSRVVWYSSIYTQVMAAGLDVVIPTLYPPSDEGDQAEGAEEESLGFSPDEVLPDGDLSPAPQDGGVAIAEPERKRRRL